MRIDGRDISIDAFGRPAGAYFLSHFHGDHLSGLRKGWTRGPLYGSAITAGLLRQAYRVDESLIRVIEPGQTVTVPDNGSSFEVTATEANHCPGAVMLHFRWPDQTVLYTGDFRLDDRVRRTARRFAGADLAFIDGTYDDPQYVFPAQEETIDRVLQLVEANIHKQVYLAIYNIGKTKILEAVVRKFGRPVYVSENVRQLYKAMGMQRLVTGDPQITNICGYSRSYFHKYFKWRSARYRPTHAVIIPTGWAISDNRNRYGYFYVPYSEHCN